jgi:hypothetical protein
LPSRPRLISKPIPRPLFQCLKQLGTVCAVLRQKASEKHTQQQTHVF